MTELVLDLIVPSASVYDVNTRDIFRSVFSTFMENLCQQHYLSFKHCLCAMVRLSTDKEGVFILQEFQKVPFSHKMGNVADMLDVLMEFLNHAVSNAEIAAETVSLSCDVYCRLCSKI